jgi:hypothetical protein
MNDSENEPRLVSFPGCHPIIYPVELPEWLPHHIVEKMTDLFKAHLRMELTSMVKGVEESARVATTQRKQHTSHQSESNISVASTNRDGDDDADFNEWPGAAKN